MKKTLNEVLKDIEQRLNSVFQKLIGLIIM